jgi:hypothetical protein
MNTNYKTKYIPPARNSGIGNPTGVQTNPSNKPMAFNETNFPTLSSTPKDNRTSPKIPMVVTSNTNTMLNFKMVAEIAKDLPDPKPIYTSISVEPIPEVEVFDLTPYVVLQERRQAEYDDIYGEGAFVNDRLNYDRFSEPSSESDETDSNVDEDDLMDY